MTKPEWTAIATQLPPGPLKDRIREAWRAADGDFEMFVSVHEAAESGVEELLAYATDLIDRQWN